MQVWDKLEQIPDDTPFRAAELPVGDYWVREGKGYRFHYAGQSRYSLGTFSVGTVWTAKQTETFAPFTAAPHARKPVTA